jgi:hypothetical protein
LEEEKRGLLEVKIDPIRLTLPLGKKGFGPEKDLLSLLPAAQEKEGAGIGELGAEVGLGGGAAREPLLQAAEEGLRVAELLQALGGLLLPADVPKYVQEKEQEKKTQQQGQGPAGPQAGKGAKEGVEEGSR